MGRRKKPPAKSTSESTEDGARPLARLLEVLGLTIVGSLVAARTLFPSEDARTGSGAWFIMLAFATLVIAGLASAVAGRSFKPRGFEFLWLIFLGMQWASAFKADYRYPAIWLAWEWTGIAAVWFAVRLFAMPTSLRLLSNLIIAVAVGQAGYACLQEFSIFPDLRQRYARGDPELLKGLEQVGLSREPGGFDRVRDRLESKETPGTFGLANSLAGFFVVAIPLLVFGGVETQWNWRSIVRYGLIALLAFGLLLTRSRTAWVATLLASGFCWLMQRSQGRVMPIRLFRLIAAGFVLCGLIAGLTYAGVFDRLVLLESSKSLRYRLEYWHGALGVIREQPVFGVGYGNFQSHYLKYKLPQASEEIEDPHNFVFELWACMGPETAAAYILLLGLLWLAIVGRVGSESPPNALLRPMWTLVCGALGIGLASTFSSLDLDAAAFMAASLVLIAFLESWPSSDNDTLAAAVAAGLLGLHINFLGAGGIGFPGLTLPVFALAAAAIGPAPATSPSSWRAATGWFAAAIGLTLALTYNQTLFRPWSEREQFLNLARNSRLENQAWLESLDKAAAMLPDDQLGWTTLAQAWQQHMLQAKEDRETKKAFANAVRAWERACKLEPRKAANYRALGQLYGMAGKRNLVEGARDAAAASLSFVVLNYPNSARNHLELADALWEIDKKDDAKVHYAKALKLDNQSPHIDKKLKAEDRVRAENLAGPSNLR